LQETPGELDRRRQAYIRERLPRTPGPRPLAMDNLDREFRFSENNKDKEFKRRAKQAIDDARRDTAKKLAALRRSRAAVEDRVAKYLRKRRLVQKKYGHLSAEGLRLQLEMEARGVFDSLPVRAARPQLEVPVFGMG